MDVREMQDAGKEKLGRAAALRLAREAERVVVARGRKITEFAMRESPPDDETLLSAILGPTGNLRAPTLRKGKTLYVGFHPETYERLL